MIDDPLGKVETFVQAGADMITFHLEGARQTRTVSCRLSRGRQTSTTRHAA